MKLPDPGLYRTHKPYPGHEAKIPADVLVYIGVPQNGGMPFVVRPGANRNNRWFWGDGPDTPVVPLRAQSWADGLLKLPAEGFYNLPRELDFDGGGRWLHNAIVQLGYNDEGRGILFVAEQHDGEERNVLLFSDRGRVIEDELLLKLKWAPILPVNKEG